MSKVKHVAGIDLGSSTLCVAGIEGSKPTVLVNSEGNRTTPSMMSIKNGERKVGGPAKRQAVMDPKNTVMFVKRFMGVPYDDPDALKMSKMAAYDVVNENGKPRIKLDGKNYTPEEISAHYLTYMAKIASDWYGDKVTDVVITCPAWYNDIQRNAVKQAGELAGLNVLRVINEPTAAILASDIDVKKKPKVIVVNDLGGGTEDVTVCEVSDVDGQKMIEVLASYGDVFLGGQNYDNAIVQWICSEFEKDNPGIDLHKDPMAYSRVVEAAEKAKIELSASASAEINLPYIMAKDGKPLMLAMTLTRAKYTALTQDLTDRVIGCARTAIEKAHKTVDEVDEILLVGGMTRGLNIQEALTEAFHKPLNKSVNPDEAVALGAAKQANIIVGGVSADDVLLLDVTPISLGIETMGNVMTKLIDANTTIPVTKKQVFSTAEDNQPSVTIVVLQGERPMATDNKEIGRFNLDGIAPARHGVPQIEVSFDIDANGILSVKAQDKGTGKEQHITIESPNSLSQEEIDRIKADAEKFREQDEKKEKEIKELNSAESFIYGIENAMKDDSFKSLIPADKVDELSKGIEEAKSFVEKRDLEGLKPALEKVHAIWDPVVESMYKQSRAQDGGNADQSTSNDISANGPDNAPYEEV